MRHEFAHATNAERRLTERRLQRRALAAALLLSAAIHALVLLFVGVDVDVAPDAASPPQPIVRIAPAMQAYQIDVVAVDAPPLDVQVRLQEERRDLREVPAFAVPAAPPAAAAPTPVPGDPSLNRLRYRNPTQEIWKRAEPPPPTPEELLRERVATRIDAYNDSIAAEAAARERATDWTVKDGDGGRWGVSPGKIHLGDITLPLPFALNAPPEKREEVAARVRTWQEIQTQATRVEGREMQKDRVRAIRERMDAERAARQNATVASPPTTSGGGTPPAGGSTGGAGGTGGGAGGGGGGGGGTGGG